MLLWCGNGDVVGEDPLGIVIFVEICITDRAYSFLRFYYTIPATQNTPYPTLPISFLSVAAYLASAVEDFRRMEWGGSGGMGWLAKILDTLYPAEVESA